jgi:aldehyde:ferredoxin oxidoreductase
VVDEPVSNVIELRAAMKRRYPEATEFLGDRNLSVAVNGEMPLSGEKTVRVKSGDKVTLMTMISGG